MAYISFQPKDFYNTLLWEGTAATNARTGLGFQPDLVWGKCRDASGRSNVLTDSVRGYDSQLSCDDGNVPTTYTNVLTSFDADGFTLGADSATGEMNNNGDDFAGWNWKAGTTSGITTNGSTTITPSSYSFSTTAGFSILKYTGNDTNSAKLAHGVGAKPDFILIKSYENSQPWVVNHVGLTNQATYGCYVNNASAEASAQWWWDNTLPDTVNINLSSNSIVNSSSYTYIAYCFTSIKGFSNFGYYTGNGVVDGPFIYTGFRPAFVIIKNRGNTESYGLYDSKRLGYNPALSRLSPSSQNVEDANQKVEFVSNGVKIRSAGDGHLNVTNNDYIYMTFAEFPIVSSNSKPTVAR